MRIFSFLILLIALFLPSGHASGSSPSDISKAELKKLQTQAAQGDAKAQVKLEDINLTGESVSQDYATARGWYEKAAAQGNADAQANLDAMK